PTDDPDRSLRTAWNEMIRDTITLPLLLPALLDGFQELDLSLLQQRSIVRSIAQDSWWSGHRRAACGETALGEALTGASATGWRIVAAASARPLPSAASVAPEALLRIVPRLAAWAAARDLSLLFDKEAVLS